MGSYRWNIQASRPSQPSTSVIPKPQKPNTLEAFKVHQCEENEEREIILAIVWYEEDHDLYDRKQTWAEYMVYRKSDTCNQRRSTQKHRVLSHQADSPGSPTRGEISNPDTAHRIARSQASSRRYPPALETFSRRPRISSLAEST